MRRHAICAHPPGPASSGASESILIVPQHVHVEMSDYTAISISRNLLPNPAPKCIATPLSCALFPRFSSRGRKEGWTLRNYILTDIQKGHLCYLTALLTQEVLCPTRCPGIRAFSQLKALSLNILDACGIAGSSDYRYHGLNRVVLPSR